KYFKQAPPKTTGRELFGFSFADDLIEQGKKRKLSNNDVIATVTAITAVSIARSYEQFIKPQVTVARIILGGGGTENATIQKLLREAWPSKVTLNRPEDYGVSTKFKEALLFALLAYTTHFGIPNNVPRCTGANQRVCLGNITRA